MPVEFRFSDRILTLVQGDITQVVADAIGNAANAQLAGGGGVDGAIHQAGGPSIMRELDVIRRESGGCATGAAVVTSAGELPARWVIHAVGPIYDDGSRGEPDQLRSCYRRCLELATELGAGSLSLPSISTGVYGYPIQAAADIALGTAGEFLRERETSLRRVTFVLFGRAAFDTFATSANGLFGG